MTEHDFIPEITAMLDEALAGDDEAFEEFLESVDPWALKVTLAAIRAPVTAAEAHQREQEERGQLYYPQRPA